MFTRQHFANYGISQTSSAFLETVTHTALASYSWPQAQSVDKADLELFLLQPLKGWNDQCATMSGYRPLLCIPQSQLTSQGCLPALSSANMITQACHFLQTETLLPRG